MGLYAGVKSLDAEIHLDLENKSILMDYTLNAKSHWSSNTGVVFQSEWWDLPIHKRFLQALGVLGIEFFIVIAMPFYTLVSTMIFNSGFITNPKAHLKDQSFRKWVYEQRGGIVVSIRPVIGCVEIVHIPNNLYLKYEIEGDASYCTKSIGLVRHFDYFERYGKYMEIRQNGWDLIFTFSQVPSKSFILVKYVA